MATTQCAADGDVHVARPTGDAGEATPLWGVWELWCSTGAAAPVAPATADSTGPTAAASAEASGSGSKWLDAVRSVALFDTAEGLWGVVDSVVPPSGLPPGWDYYALRKHVAPMWEHEANRRGGRWVATFHMPTHPPAGAAPVSPLDHGGGASPGGSPVSATPAPPGVSTSGGLAVLPPAVALAAADATWEELLLAAAGERLAEDDAAISGVVASRRRQALRIAVWTRSSADTRGHRATGAAAQALVTSAVAAALLAAGGHTAAEAAALAAVAAPVVAFAPHRAALERPAAGRSPLSGRSPVEQRLFPRSTSPLSSPTAGGAGTLPRKLAPSPLRERTSPRRLSPGPASPRHAGGRAAGGVAAAVGTGVCVGDPLAPPYWLSPRGSDSLLA